jgi:hypothetical protein
MVNGASRVRNCGMFWRNGGEDPGCRCRNDVRHVRVWLRARWSSRSLLGQTLTSQLVSIDCMLRHILARWSEQMVDLKLSKTQNRTCWSYSTKSIKARARSRLMNTAVALQVPFDSAQESPLRTAVASSSWPPLLPIATPMSAPESAPDREQ